VEGSHFMKAFLLGRVLRQHRTPPAQSQKRKKRQTYARPVHTHSHLHALDQLCPPKASCLHAHVSNGLAPPRACACVYTVCVCTLLRSSLRWRFVYRVPGKSSWEHTCAEWRRVGLGRGRSHSMTLDCPWGAMGWGWP
jgi:hypothetical protein